MTASLWNKFTNKYMNFSKNIRAFPVPDRRKVEGSPISYKDVEAFRALQTAGVQWQQKLSLTLCILGVSADDIDMAVEQDTSQGCYCGSNIQARDQQEIYLT